MKANEEKKQLQLNELTFIQQIALEGEVSALMYNTSDDTEKMYYAFMKLALCEDRHLLVYKSEFKKYLDETIVDDIVRYRYMELIPTYLFINKYIKEIRGMLGEDCGSMRIAKYPVEVVKSKFVLAMRELLTYIPVTANAIIDGISRELEDDIEFLRPITFALKEEAPLSVIEQQVGYDVKVKLLSAPIDKAPVLSLQIEEERLAKEERLKGMSSEERVKDCLTSLASALDSFVALAKGEDPSSSDEYEEAPEKLVYLVKKIDISNGQVVFTKEFDTQKQAADYIKNVVKDYPEIVKRYNFVVELTEA